MVFIMGKYKTKHFGEIELSIEDDGIWAYFDTMYNGQDITVVFANYKFYGDKINVCWEIIDKYDEINKIAKRAIVETFPKKEVSVNIYFKRLFENDMTEEELINVFGVKDFKNLNIKKTVEKFVCPNIIFNIEDDNIDFSVGYLLSKKYSDKILLVIMDEKINIKGFRSARYPNLH